MRKVRRFRVESLKLFKNGGRAKEEDEEVKENDGEGEREFLTQKK